MAIVDQGPVYNTSSASSQTQSATKKGSNLDQNAFLKMLLAQIQQQDPLNPMDSTQFAAQLAQFTTVEQISAMNTKMTTMIEKLSASTNAQMINLVGKEAVYRGDVMYVSGGKATEGSVQLSLDAAVQVSIYDANGSLVRTMSLGEKKAGETIRINWDGADYNGQAVPDGTYTFQIKADRGDDQNVTVTTFATGKITAYKSDSQGNPTLVINNTTSVPYANIMEVRLPQTTDGGEGGEGGEG